MLEDFIQVPHVEPLMADGAAREVIALVEHKLVDVSPSLPNGVQIVPV